MPFSIDLNEITDETISVNYRRNLFEDQIDCLYPEDCFYNDRVCSFIRQSISRGEVVIRMAEHDLIELDCNAFQELELRERLGKLTNYDACFYNFLMWSQKDDWLLLGDQFGECFVFSTKWLVWENVYGRDFKAELQKRHSEFIDFISKVWVGLTEDEKQKILANYRCFQYI